MAGRILCSTWAGLQPNRDIAVRFTGLRSGEKLSEELLHGDERLEATPVPRPNVGSPRSPALAAACIAGCSGEAVKRLRSLVQDSRPFLKRRRMEMALRRGVLQMFTIRCRIEARGGRSFRVLRLGRKLAI
jgi:FlaA1/EpsC-like NDP-sugar epimerase